MDHSVELQVEEEPSAPGNTAGRQLGRLPFERRLENVSDAFTFAGLAVRLQSEANRAAAANSRHGIVTRAIAAAIVHRTRLCRENGRSRSYNSHNNYTVDAASLTHFFSLTTHAHCCHSEGGEEKKKRPIVTTRPLFFGGGCKRGRRSTAVGLQTQMKKKKQTELQPQVNRLEEMLVSNENITQPNTGFLRALCFCGRRESPSTTSWRLQGQSFLTFFSH